MQPQQNILRVCSYNIGAHVGDYMLLCKYVNPNMSDKRTREEDAAFRAKYEKIQDITSKILENIADVFCLQEVVELDRPLMKMLQANDFHVVRCETVPYFDSAVVLNKKRFKDITNFSFVAQITETFPKDVAVALATEISSGQKMCFVSGHAPGCDLTRAVRADDAADGDIYCRLVAQKLHEIAKGTLQVVGVDMNVNPEKWKGRFKIFTDEGFKIGRSNAITNVNSRDVSYKEREIDFFLFKPTGITASVKCFGGLGFDPEKNQSDHLPVCLEMSVQPIKTSVLKKLFG